MLVLQWVTPFRYFLVTRIVSRSALVAWVFTYVTPVVLLSYVVAPMALINFIVACIFLLSLVYTVYEYGYIFNDAITVGTELNPTIRITPNERNAITLLLPTIFYSRIALLIICAICFGLSVARPGRHAYNAFLYASLLGVAILCVYGIYNRIRARSTIILFLLLVGLRFGGPITVIAWLDGVDTSILGAVIVLYPLPNAIEFAGKSRFGIPLLAFIPRNVDLWRVVYYFTLCIFTYMACSIGSLGGKVMIVGASYFFIYRIITLGASFYKSSAINSMRKNLKK